MIAARLLSLLAGYVFGLFQTAYLYGRTKGIDIRDKGSGNAGTTNSIRVLGWKAGALTFLGDFFKAVLAVLLVKLVFGERYAESVKVLELYAGFGAVLGHNFPCYLQFRGGKGIACSAGVVVAVYQVCFPGFHSCNMQFSGTGYYFRTAGISASGRKPAGGILCRVRLLYRDGGLEAPGKYQAAVKRNRK